MTTVPRQEADLIASITDQALELSHPITASLTGGEPLLHPEFEHVRARYEIEPDAARAAIAKHVEDLRRQRLLQPAEDTD